MSRKNQSSGEDFIGEVLLFVVGLIWAVVAGLIALVVKGWQIPPEVELRQLGQPAYWGHKLTPTKCPHCSTKVEHVATVCFGCGTAIELPQRAGAVRDPAISQNEITSRRTGVIVIVIIVAIAVTVAITTLS